MCGIAGLTANADIEAGITAMLSVIPHRGPDGAGHHRHQNTAIGMTRLSIIDLESGMQPFSDNTKKSWMVCNGEIYNFKSLRKSLEAYGHKFVSHSDAEVIVHAYQQFGLEFIDHIEGMFGLAIHDTERDRIVIARDRLGIKPLYYYDDGGQFGFASEIKSLLTLPFINPDLDNEALHQYLNYGYALAPDTLFRGIHKLAPGEMLVREGGSSRLFTYWSPAPAVDETLSEDDCIDAVRSTFRGAVESHLVSDVPLGSFLSGGIDSSAIVANIAELEPASLSTYSIGYEGDATEAYYNELPYADKVAARFSTDHHRIVVAPDVAQLLPKLVWHLEEPICDSAAITTHLVSALASQSVKVIMSGVGGDELFAGYNRYQGERITKQYLQVPGFIRKGLNPLFAALPVGRGNPLLDYARYAQRIAAASEMPWRERYASYLTIGNSAQLLGTAPQRDPFAELCASVDSQDALQNLMQIDLRSQMSECLLLMTDKITMASSIECRVPFLERELVELANTIPAHIKLHKGRLKHVLKEAVSNQLPHDIIDRKKRGFGAPIGSWLSHKLSGLQDALLGEHGLERRGIFDPALLRAMRASHDAKKFDGSDLLMVLMNLELIFQLFWDNRTPDSISETLSGMTGIRNGSATQ